MASTPNPAAQLQHVRPVRPLHFPISEPDEEHLGQSRRHLVLCMLLAELLKRVCVPQHSWGADQFVYWNPRDPKLWLAPDGFVKLGVPDEMFDLWKTWESGVPELAVEVLMSDTPESLTLAEKVERYHALGVRELVVFDFDSAPGARLRVWDLIEGDMVDRLVIGECTPCIVLSATGPSFEWIIAPADGEPAALRLRCEGALVPTPEENVASLRRSLEEERSALAVLERRLRGG